MRLLVTGALGFIGSYFCKYVLSIQPDVKIVALDNNAESKQMQRVAELFQNLNFKLVVSDINSDLSEVLEGVDVIVNFAAKTFVDHSVKHPNSHFWNNTNGTFNLLYYARIHKPSLFVQISTDEIYGEAKPDGSGHDELSAFNPTNPYSASKAASDALVMGFGKTYGIPYLITRCENNYGPFQHPQKVLPTFVKMALDDKYLPLYNPGTQRRCWIHVEDHCSAIWYLIKHSQKGIFNIGVNKSFSNMDLAKIVLGALNKRSDAIMMVDTREIRPYHDSAYKIDASKLWGLGWLPKYEDATKGLEETINWFRDNKEWLE